jgi:hypothetical protein
MPKPLFAALCLLAAGCAASPEAPEPTAVLAQAEPEKAAAAANDPVDTVQEARKAGYRIVNEGGKTLYCREQKKTGSRLRKETICLTEEELASVREALKRDLDQMQMRRGTPPPHGT